MSSYKKYLDMYKVFTVQVEGVPQINICIIIIYSGLSIHFINCKLLVLLNQKYYLGIYITGEQKNAKMCSYILLL